MFEVVAPQSEEIPVVVEVPHAGLELDPESLSYCAAPAASIGQDADLYVSTLFADAPHQGAHLIYSTASRYFCDLNRAEDDLDSLTTPHGMSSSSPHGVIWRRTTTGRSALVSTLPASEVERRLALLYRPYHQAVQRLIDQKKARFGYCILLCGHSMPSYGRLGDARADIVPGSQGGTSSALELLTVADQVSADHGYCVAHDAPYKGGYSTQTYGRPSEAVHALQIELARRIYMNETTLAQRPVEFRTCRLFCRALVEALGKIPAQALRAESALKCAE